MDPETLRGWWFGWRWGNDWRVKRELLRSQAAIVRHNSAVLREEASFTRWHSERECEYGRYLRDRLGALRSAAEARRARWPVPRRSDPAAEPLAVPVATVPESGTRPTARTQPHRSSRGRARSETAPA